MITHRGIFLLVSLFTGVLLLSNFIDYQHTLSTGDHGLVLYAAEATLRGEVPFHDYHYFYGPLMPYYYGLMLKIFGNTISGVLVGELLLRLLCGILIYSALSLFIHPFLSFAGSLWFWVYNKEFFYTYNHIGINVASLFIFLMVCQYLKNSNVKCLHAALVGCVMAGLVKLSFGIVLCLGLFLSVLFINIVEKRMHPAKFYAAVLLGTPLLILLSNWAFVVGLPFYIIKQCYQYFGTDAVASYYPDLPTAAKYFIGLGYKGVVKSWYSELLLIIIAIIGMANIYEAKKGRITEFGLKGFMTLVILALIFYGISLHEYILSGIYFRTFYAYPFLIIGMFLALGYMARQIPRFVLHSLTLVLCLISLTQFGILLTKMQVYRSSGYYLPMKKAKIFVSNKAPWAQVVTKATLYLQDHMKDDETLLALPYDPLYYYLLDRKSPTRQLATFGFLQMPPEQEQDILRELQTKNVKWILISNRAITREIGLGVFGDDCCHLLARYIADHYQTVQQFGEWTTTPSWAWHHGVRILKRKDPS